MQAARLPLQPDYFGATEATRLRQPAFVPHSRDYGGSRGYGVTGSTDVTDTTLDDTNRRKQRTGDAVLDATHKYGQHSFVKTTLEIPEPLFRKAKATAARQGRTLKQLLQEALSEKIARIDGAGRRQKPWMVLAGRLKHLHSENRRIERVIEAEFENIEPEDRQ